MKAGVQARLAKHKRAIVAQRDAIRRDRTTVP
jgi:hypothetical protein